MIFNHNPTIQSLPMMRCSSYSPHARKKTSRSSPEKKHLSQTTIPRARGQFMALTSTSLLTQSLHPTAASRSTSAPPLTPSTTSTSRASQSPSRIGGRGSCSADDADLRKPQVRVSSVFLPVPPCRRPIPASGRHLSPTYLLCHITFLHASPQRCHVRAAMGADSPRPPRESLPTSVEAATAQDPSHHAIRIRARACLYRGSS